MVWHIFKKDWKLLWPFFLAVAATQFIPSIIRLKLGLFGENRALQELLGLFGVIAFVGSAFLIAAVVHQDSIPGVRQDWLVRPIRRRDLLLAKFSFVLVLAQGPFFVADLLQALASGFPLRQSLVAAISRALVLLLSFTLPVFAFASLTQNSSEAIVGGVAFFFLFFVFQMLANAVYGSSGYLDPAGGTGTQWVTDSTRSLVLLLGASTILGVQYLRRKTVSSRWLAAIVFVLFMLAEFLPWKSVFAFEQRLSPDSSVGRSVSVAFDPSMGKFQRPSGMTMSDEEMWRHLRQEGGTKSELFLPLHVSGLPSDAILKADKSEIRLIGSDGRVAYSGSGADLEIRKEGPSDGQATIYQEVDIPDTFYGRLKNQPLRLEVDYSLTLFRLGSAYGIPALGGDQRASGLGWCETQMNESGTAIELHCMQAGQGATCRTVFLVNVSTGLRNPVKSDCSPDYSPYFQQFGPDAISSFGTSLPFRDPSGLAHFPVDGPQLPKSQVVLRLYQPEDHFTRRLAISAVRLEDWESR